MVHFGPNKFEIKFKTASDHVISRHLSRHDHVHNPEWCQGAKLEGLGGEALLSRQDKTSRKSDVRIVTRFYSSREVRKMSNTGPVLPLMELLRL
ncbi:hypothetical protein RSAG8_09175, partial [Rhizoctonia solani AG-8 WAC10335]